MRTIVDSIGYTIAAFITAAPSIIMNLSLMLRLITRQFKQLVGLLSLCLVACTSTFDQGMEAYLTGDYATAIEIWQKMEKGGDLNAIYNLAGMYRVGEGTPQDHQEAMRLYRAGARMGDGQAQYSLASMYELGQGAETDLVLAYVWLTASIKAGYLDAPLARNRLQILMTDEQVAEAEELFIVCNSRFMQEC